MMRLVNFDTVMYIILQAMKHLQKAGRDDLAKLVEGLAQDLQENLDEIVVENCPVCGARFGGGSE